MNTNGINHILIVGGGTAGWMTASLLNHHWRKWGIQVSLVESAEIGIIGVGEGSTPKMKDLFDTLEIDEAEWMPACNGTYKNGITFKDWSTIPGHTEYFHPFGCTIDSMTYQFFREHTVLRRQGHDVDVTPERYFLMSQLAAHDMAPKAAQNFPFQFDYAYHFDSMLVGRFLRDKAVERGVRHMTGTVEHVRRHENGDLAAIELADGTCLDADFFIDCTGFASILLQKTLQVPFVSFADNLFNDRAIAMPSEISGPIPSATVSTAMKHGWAWKIPLTNRYGNGYVYSSDYCSEDEAETELRSHLGLLDDDTEARHLNMRVGCTERSWVRNCLGIGLSQGFIEPLEATAIQFIQTSVEMFIQAFQNGEFSNYHQQKYNDKVNQNYAGIRDYIVLHYQTNSRTDTDYWINNRENPNISDQLRDIMDCWHRGGYLEDELQRLGVTQYYSPISWNCMLAGTGQFPPVSSRNKQHPGQVNQDYLQQFFADCLLNFKPHREQLKLGPFPKCA
ncbi:tryptophan halogenase family protein [Marinicella meishanensis]|uniref:tryptophan halogenase family protein n=1 Tax=Marinicella meishanensis TaxID=2873263 RepID=UPI001CBF08B0|nr:tryptophan halogenase family protein [Marinicella sp. NBU2979]